MESSQQQRQRTTFARGKRFGNARNQNNGSQSNDRGGHYSGQRDTKMHNGGRQSNAALNCIVDESALLAGLSAADGLKKWVREGSINVFVPLYTLEKLNTLRSSPPPLNLNARKTLEWLDHITSITENKTAGHVGLQGPDDQYQTWQEVEKYLLPETPLSSHHGPSNLDGITESLDYTLQIRDSPSLSKSSFDNGKSDSGSVAGSTCASASLRASEEDPASAQGISHGRDTSYSSTVSGYSVEDDSTPYLASDTAGIPSPVRPLLNYVVWRTYNEAASVVGSGKYVLLTDDPATRKQAQQFGVRAKLLSQVRNIVSRSENKPQNQVHINGAPKNRRAGSKSDKNMQGDMQELGEENEDDADEVVFDPASRPGSSRNTQPATNVWDPDHFGRTPLPPVTGDQSESVTKELTVPGQRPASSGQAAYTPTGPAAGRGQSRSMRGRGLPNSPRGQTGSSRGTPQHKLDNPIDPDSYARPQPPGRRGRGGAFRRLWDPNT